MRLREAVCEALRDGGIELLSLPKRFLAHVMDRFDPDDPVAMLFEANCDAELLEFYRGMARDPRPDVISSTVDRVTTLLINVRFIKGNIARRMACEVALGVCAFLGVTPPDSVARATQESYDRPQEVYGPAPGRQSGRSGSSASYVQHAGGSASYGAGGSSYGGSSYGGSAFGGSSYGGSSYGSQSSSYVSTGSSVGSGSSVGVGSSSIVGSRGTAGVTKQRRAFPKVIIAIAIVLVVGTIAAVGLSRIFSQKTDIDGSDSVAQIDTNMAGTWTPVSVTVDGADEDDYQTRLRCAQEGDLTLRDDGSFTRSVFPDLLEGTWEGSDNEVTLSPKAKDAILTVWDDEEVDSKIEGTLANGQLEITYAGGVSVTYVSGAQKPSSESYIGLWEVVELAQDGNVQYGVDVFDKDRAAGWYTEYLDLRSNGTIVWDRQGSKYQGSWRVAAENQAIAYIRDGNTNGYWCGLVELKDEKLTFYYGGENNWETFRRAQTDNRSDLKIPERN